MTECKEKDDRNKAWEDCKMHFKRCYIAPKRFHDAKGTKGEELSRIDTDITLYWEAMKEQQAKEQAEAN